MDPARRASSRFNLKRYFFLLSLILMVVATIGLTTYLRNYSASQLLLLKRSQAESLAQVFENSLWSIFQSLVEPENRDLDKLTALSRQSLRRDAVINLMQGTDVIKLKVYALDGVTVFSTDYRQVGKVDANNPGFIGAAAGKTISQQTHRNTFDAFEGELTDREVISTYAPVHNSDGKVEGVIEIYLDATPFVKWTDAQLFWLTIGISGLMLLLYLIQLLVVGRAARILDSQATELAESNRELDLRVEKRTRQLRDSNTQLQDEIHERRKVEEKLDRLAHFDLLTGLPNRLMFVEVLRASLAEAAESRRRLALLFIDLDRFKDVNDTLGHFTGDQLLKAVVTEMASCVRPSDTLARFGGDEFACILRDADDDAIATCAQKLLDCFDEPFIVDGNKLYISASIGICQAPQDGDEVETLVRNADIAMYRAKAVGRNHFQHYTQEMSDAVDERRLLDERLHKAIEDERIDVHFQAKVESGNGSLAGAEALARWNDEVLGPVSPGRFIPVAEETGLIVALGAQVLEKVCSQMRAWREAGFDVPCVSVNVSVKQLEQDDFPKRLAALLHKYDVSPSCLELEITESVIMAIDDALGILKRIRNLGVKLAIDDFGTGYSSLSYLKQLPVEVLKIDRAFIVGIGRSTHDEAIIRAVISLSESLGLTTVAEGVEEESQVAFLSSAGCNLIQGYYYDRPQPAADFCRVWLSEREKAVA